MKTLYGDVSNNVFEKAQNIKLLICDVDGVFSDGRIYLGNDGEELKAFHTKDGFGVKALIHSGVEVGIITGRRSNIVLNRMKSLNVKYISQGQEDKLPSLIEMSELLALKPEQVAYIGDDIPDLACIEKVGLGIAVADAHPAIKAKADYTTHTLGGFGAVREICDIIMQAQNTLTDAFGASV